MIKNKKQHPKPKFQTEVAFAGANSSRRQNVAELKSTKAVARMGILAALSVVVLLVIPRIPIMPAAPYLQYDMADVPIFLTAFLMNPIAGYMVLAAVSLIQGVMLGESGLVGAVMHFMATGSFIFASTFVAGKIKGSKSMIIGLLAGTLTMTLMMIPLNLVITVYFWGSPLEVVLAALVPAIIPFNLIKAGVNSIIFYFVYKVVKQKFN